MSGPKRGANEGCSHGENAAALAQADNAGAESYKVYARLTEF